MALGEIAPDAISDGDIGTRFDLYSGCASTSAGIELMGHEIVVLGMSGDWSGPLAIDHAVMVDAIDAASVREALARLPDGPVGAVRGRRHTMLDDSDISAMRHARAFVGGVLSGLFGMTDIYVSGEAEHQEPPAAGRWQSLSTGTVSHDGPRCRRCNAMCGTLCFRSTPARR